MRDKPWPGLRQDTSDLGEESWGALENVQLRIQGEVRDRPGLGQRHALPADLLAFLETSTNRRLVGFRNGTISSVDADTPAAAFTVKASLSTTIGSFAQSNGRLYYANGTDPVQLISDGSVAAVAAGITAPVGAPTAGTPGAGSVTVGVHLIRYRYKNSSTGYFSNPSPALSFTAAGSQNVPLTLVASLDAKVDKIVVEMTQVDGNAYYVVATIANGTSYTINVSDAILGVQQLADVYSSPDGYGHEPPPAAIKVLCEHRNRVFGLDGNGYLYWSRASFPESWNALNWAKQVFTTKGDKPIAMASFFGDLYIIGSRGMARMAYTGDPASGMMVQIPANLGVFNHRCLVDVEGAIYGFGRDGVWRITAMQPELISPPAQIALQNIDMQYATATAHAVFDPEERVVWCFYRAIGDTSVRDAVCFDLMSGQWSTRSFRHTISASGTFGSSTLGTVVYLSDNNGGYTWRLTQGVWDCVPTTMPNGVITVQPGSTTSVINTAETIADVVGSIVYDPALGEERVVTGYTVTSITVGVPFTGVPVSYSQQYLGSIQQVIESGWIPVDYAFVGRRPDTLNIEHMSVAASLGVEYKVEYFQDYSSAPTVMTSVPDDAATRGLTLVNGYTYLTQNVDAGSANIPCVSDFNTVIKWRLTREKPIGRMRLLDASIHMRDQKKAQDIPH